MAVLSDARPPSFWVEDAIFDLKVGSHAKLVYMYLCRKSNKSSVSWPSWQTIADAISESVSSVRRGIEELVGAGAVSVESGGLGGGANRYTINQVTPLVAEDGGAAHRERGAAHRERGGPLSVNDKGIHIQGIHSKDSAKPVEPARVPPESGKENRPKKPDPRRDMDTVNAMAHWRRRFSKAHGVEPHEKKSDSHVMQTVTQQYPRSETQELLDAFFDSTDPWFAKMGHSVKAFSDSINKLLSARNGHSSPKAEPWYGPGNLDPVGPPAAKDRWDYKQ